MMSARLVYPNCHFCFIFAVLTAHAAGGDKNTENRGWKTVARLNDEKWRQNGLQRTLKWDLVDKNGMISKVNINK